MKEKQYKVRQQGREHVALLASASEQQAYQCRVPHIPVLQELVSGFADDFYHPKSSQFIDAFSEEELRQLSILFGLVHRAAQKLCKDPVCSLQQALKSQEWREVIAFAKELTLK